MTSKNLRREHIDNLIVDDLEARNYNWDNLQSYMQENDAEIARLESELGKDISDERKRSIQDTLDKLKEAKTYADGKIATLKQQAAADASGKADQALEDAKTYARAQDSKLKGEAAGDATTKADKALADSKKYVDGKVKTDVPTGAKFTDTVYTHPSSHPASMITESTTRRFTSDSEKARWDAKETPEGAQTKADGAYTEAKDYVDSRVKTYVPTGARFTDTIVDISGKVDKVAGKGLTSNDYTDADKSEVGKIKDKADKTYVDGKVGTDVPRGAKFTDTEYTSGSNITIDENNVISATGKLGLTEEDVKVIKVDSAKDADTVSGFVVEKDVPADAKFTDTLVDISGKADKAYVDSKVEEIGNRNIDGGKASSKYEGFPPIIGGDAHGS